MDSQEQHGLFVGSSKPVDLSTGHDPLYWRLRYADDREVSEPPENASIRSAPKGAVELQVIERSGRLVYRVDCREFYPIWYRRRSMALGVERFVGRHDATIFGRARFDDRGIHVEDNGTFQDVEFHGTLFAAWNGHIRDCPVEWIDARAIMSLIEGAGEG